MMSDYEQGWEAGFSGIFIEEDVLQSFSADFRRGYYDGIIEFMLEYGCDVIRDEFTWMRTAA
jgi:hypothetical protein